MELLWRLEIFQSTTHPAIINNEVNITALEFIILVKIYLDVKDHHFTI
jgi:hypothetical protein